MNKKLLTVVIAMSIFMSACTVLKPVDNLSVSAYTLSTSPLVKRHASRGHSLLITPVVAAPGIESAGMIYTRKTFQVEEFTKHRWVAPPAALLSYAIQENAIRSHLFQTVLLSPALGAADRRLDTVLLRFQQNYNKQPAEVELTAQVTYWDNQSGRLIASKLFDMRQTMKSSDPYEGVMASNKAVSRLVREINLFLLQRS